MPASGLELPLAASPPAKRETLLYTALTRAEESVRVIAIGGCGADVGGEAGAAGERVARGAQVTPPADLNHPGLRRSA